MHSIKLFIAIFSALIGLILVLNPIKLSSVKTFDSRKPSNDTNNIIKKISVNDFKELIEVNKPKLKKQIHGISLITSTSDRNFNEFTTIVRKDFSKELTEQIKRLIMEDEFQLLTQWLKKSDNSDLKILTIYLLMDYLNVRKNLNIENDDTTEKIKTILEVEIVRLSETEFSFFFERFFSKMHWLQKQEGQKYVQLYINNDFGDSKQRKINSIINTIFNDWTDFFKFKILTQMILNQDSQYLYDELMLLVSDFEDPKTAEQKKAKEDFLNHLYHQLAIHPNKNKDSISLFKSKFPTFKIDNTFIEAKVSIKKTKRFVLNKSEVIDLMEKEKFDEIRYALLNLEEGPVCSFLFEEVTYQARTDNEYKKLITHFIKKSSSEQLIYFLQNIFNDYSLFGKEYNFILENIIVERMNSFENLPDIILNSSLNSQQSIQERIPISILLIEHASPLQLVIINRFIMENIETYLLHIDVLYFLQNKNQQALLKAKELDSDLNEKLNTVATKISYIIKQNEITLFRKYFTNIESAISDRFEFMNRILLKSDNQELKLAIMTIMINNFSSNHIVNMIFPSFLKSANQEGLINALIKTMGNQKLWSSDNYEALSKIMAAMYDKNNYKKINASKLVSDLINTEDDFYRYNDLLIKYIDKITYPTELHQLLTVLSQKEFTLNQHDYLLLWDRLNLKIDNLVAKEYIFNYRTLLFSILRSFKKVDAFLSLLQTQHSYDHLAFYISQLNESTQLTKAILSLIQNNNDLGNQKLIQALINKLQLSELRHLIDNTPAYKYTQKPDEINMKTILLYELVAATEKDLSGQLLQIILIKHYSHDSDFKYKSDLLIQIMNVANENNLIVLMEHILANKSLVPDYIYDHFKQKLVIIVKNKLYLSRNSRLQILQNKLLEKSRPQSLNKTNQTNACQKIYLK